MPGYTGETGTIDRVTEQLYELRATLDRLAQQNHPVPRERRAPTRDALRSLDQRLGPLRRALT